MTNEFATFDEIVSYMESFLEKRYEEISTELANLSQKKNLLPNEKNEKKRKKQELYNELSEIYHVYGTYNLILRKATTFERRQVVRLFTTYYTALYKKEFVSVKVGDSIVVASLADLGDNTTLEQINIDELLASSQDACIVFDHPFYTLLDGVQLSSYFAPFIEIMPVIRNLVNLSINNPTMNDRNRITEALNISVASLNESKILSKTPNSESTY